MVETTAFRAFVDQHLAPALRPLGFRRRSNTFGRRYADGWGMVSAVPSQWGTSHQAKVTVAVAVSLDALSDEHPGATATCQLPLMFLDEQWRTMLHQLLPAQDQFHWPISIDRLDEDAAVLLDLVRTYALPELDRAVSVSGLLERLLLPTNGVFEKRDEHYSTLLALTGRDEELETFAREVRSRLAAMPNEDSAARWVAHWDRHIAQLRTRPPGT